MNLQYVMYQYSISYITNEVKIINLQNPYVSLYIDDITINKLHNISTIDHRLIQTPHDTLAAVFRYKFQQGEFNNENFELSEVEIKQFFENELIDIDFLNKIDKEYWFLSKRWFEFIKCTLKQNLSITREITNSIILFCMNEIDKKNAWNSANKSSKIIKDIFDKVPWFS